MKSLVTRFHILLLTVTVAITGVALFRVPSDYAYAAHWTRSTIDWLWPREVLLVAPVVQVALLAAFFLMGRLFTKNQFAKSQHILDPALTLLMTVVASCQLGLLLTGVGSDLDFIRLTGFGLGAVLLIMAIILFEAERYTYGGVRMPWPVRSDRAWPIVHRAAALTSGAGGLLIAAGAWFDIGSGLLLCGFLAALLTPVIVAALATLVTRRW